MNKQQKKDLLKAAELIAQGKNDFICSSLNVIGSTLDIRFDPVCSMFNPESTSWWGIYNMGEYAWEDGPRNARLLGIAFMLTMPEDMIE